MGQLKDHESQTAAYLGFRNTSDLRAFAISWPVLLAEKYFLAVSKNMSRPGPFTLLDKPGTLQLIASVVTDPETAWAWGERDTKQRQLSQRKKIAAWCLYMLVQNIEQYKNATDEENLEKSAKEQQDFIERHKDNKMNVTISFPAGVNQFPVPELGPFTDKGEGQLEPYNRCWEILKYLRSGFYRSNWKTRFATLQAVENGTVVSEAHAPSWMQSPANKVVSGLSSIKKVFPNDNFAPINVEVKWVRNAKDMETEAAIQKAFDRRVQLPYSKFRLPWDPRALVRSEQFRDGVRRSLNCQELGLDLWTMLISYDHAAENESGHVDGLAQDWKDLKEIFDNPQHSNFILEVRLQAFDTDDDTFALYEDEGDPISQDTYLAIQNSQNMVPEQSVDPGEGTSKRDVTPPPEVPGARF